jgi:hypothetical protein
VAAVAAVVILCSLLLTVLILKGVDPWPNMAQPGATFVLTILKRTGLVTHPDSWSFVLPANTYISEQEAFVLTC